jgi:hypothetical protein
LRQVVSKLEGSWIDGVVADGNVLWSHVMPACRMTSLPLHQLLPSDCTLRPDVAVRGARSSSCAVCCSYSRVYQALKCGNYVEANRLKDAMESEKRAEKALREKSRK